VHLLALPVLAWFGLAQRRAPEPPTFRFEPRDERAALAEEGSAELPALDAPRPLDAAALDAAADEGDQTGAATGDPRAESLRLARFFAARGGPELPPPGPDEGEVARLLRLRAQALDAYARRTQATAEPAAAAPTGATSATGRALLAELLLDRHALAVVSGGVSPVESGDATDGRTEGPSDRLAAALAALDPAAGDAAAGLAAVALARAEAHGVYRDDGRLQRARAAFGDELGEIVLPAPARVRRVAPLARRWPALLERALAPDGARDPVVAAWLAAGR
jgi:hypothetical protein